jgi:hypothetical protein
MHMRDICLHARGSRRRGASPRPNYHFGGVRWRRGRTVTVESRRALEARTHRRPRRVSTERGLAEAVRTIRARTHKTHSVRTIHTRARTRHTHPVRIRITTSANGFGEPMKLAARAGGGKFWKGATGNQRGRDYDAREHKTLR